jgi:hypothetical protein
MAMGARSTGLRRFTGGRARVPEIVVGNAARIGRGWAGFASGNSGYLDCREGYQSGGAGRGG